jgi:hypothetical protein
MIPITVRRILESLWTSLNAARKVMKQIEKTSLFVVAAVIFFELPLKYCEGLTQSQALFRAS